MQRLSVLLHRRPNLLPSLLGRTGQPELQLSLGCLRPFGIVGLHLANNCILKRSQKVSSALSI